MKSVNEGRKSCSMHMKSADSSELGLVVDVTLGNAIIQKGLDRL